MLDKINLNIGSVIYTETNNGIKAEWIFSSNNKIEHGTGIAIRLTELNPKKRFEGIYEIIYSDRNRNKSPKLKLIISFKEDAYNLIWNKAEKMTDIGIGIEREHKLFASFTKVN